MYLQNLTDNISWADFYKYRCFNHSLLLPVRYTFRRYQVNAKHDGKQMNDSFKLKFAKFIGTGFYSGYSKKAPGTFGTVVAVLMVYAVWQFAPLYNSGQIDLANRYSANNSSLNYHKQLSS